MLNPENQTSSENHTNPSRTQAQTQKSHTNPDIKHRKIIKEYCTKQNQSIYIHKPNQSIGPLLSPCLSGH